MSPVFIFGAILVWFVIRQAKKAAREGMISGGKAASRKIRDTARDRMRGYRETVQRRGEEAEEQIERAAVELEDRWSRAEQLLGGRADDGGETTAPEELSDWIEPSLEDEVPGLDGLIVAEELPPAEPPPDAPPPGPDPKLTPYETRAAGRAAATAAAATAAAAAAELARIEAEPEPIPSDDELTESIETDLTIGVLERDLFESGRPGFEIEERFREEFGGRRVRWSGLLDRAETNLEGDRIEVVVHEVDDDPVSRPLRWTFELSPSDAEGLISQREIPLTIEGTLESCDPYLRQVSLVNARRAAE